MCTSCSTRAVVLRRSDSDINFVSGASVTTHAFIQLTWMFLKRTLTPGMYCMHAVTSLQKGETKFLYSDISNPHEYQKKALYTLIPGRPVQLDTILAFL